jgi:hypothetical protein
MEWRCGEPHLWLPVAVRDFDIASERVCRTKASSMSGGMSSASFCALVSDNRAGAAARRRQVLAAMAASQRRRPRFALGDSQFGWARSWQAIEGNLNVYQDWYVGFAGSSVKRLGNLA